MLTTFLIGRCGYFGSWFLALNRKLLSLHCLKFWIIIRLERAVRLERKNDLFVRLLCKIAWIEHFSRLWSSDFYFASSLFTPAFPLPQIYQTRRRVVLNNMVLHLKTLTLNPFPDEGDLAVYEPYQQSNLLTLRSSQKYFIPAQSYVEERDTESLAQQIRKVLL